MGQMMFHSGKVLILTSFVTLMFCVGAWAQANDPRHQSRDVVQSVRPPEPSDLAKENLERVAASAAQIQAVLIKDPGILVELKRWVAKEATDNGQIVEDDLLTDQAIFDRLDHDLAFRSVATRLVQRYGYLLPSVNPDSDLGKEQDLIMKDRAHLQATRQEHAYATALAAADAEKEKEKQEQKMERVACDPRNQSCNEPASTRQQQQRNPLPNESPLPEPVLPIMPDQLSPLDSTRTLRSAAGRDDSDVGGFSSMDQGLTLASDSSRRSSGGLG